MIVLLTISRSELVIYTLTQPRTRRSLLDKPWTNPARIQAADTLDVLPTPVRTLAVFGMCCCYRRNCSQYNAFRAFLIIAIIFLGFAIVTVTLSMLYYNQSGALLWLTVAFDSFAIVSSTICWGLVADHWKTQNDGNDYFKRGPAFGLVVTAFVLMVVALVLYVVVWRIESVGYSKSGSGYMRKEKTQVELTTTAGEDQA